MKCMNNLKISTSPSIVLLNSKRLIAMFLCFLIIVVMSPLTVFASSSGSISTDKLVGEDTAQGKKTEYSQVELNEDANTEVYLTVDRGELIVGTPTVVILDGNADINGKHFGDYSVYAKGDIPGSKTLNIYPDTDVVTMKQKGKLSKYADIRQDLISFTSNDIADGMTTTGTISVEGLTAGSWNGEFSFNINMTSLNIFYSTLDLAVSDIEADTVGTENTTADLPDIADATCSVQRIGSAYKITLFKDVENQQNIVLNKDVQINLNEHSINFASGAGLSTNENLSVHDGIINGVDPLITVQTSSKAGSFIVQNSANKGLYFDNCVVNTEYTAALSKVSYQIYTVGSLQFGENCYLNITGEGNSSYVVSSIRFLNPTVNKIEDVNITVNLAHVKGYRGVLALSNTGDFYVNNVNIDANIGDGYFYGIYDSGDNVATVKNSVIDVTINNSQNTIIGTSLVKVKESVVSNNTITIHTNGVGTSKNLYGIAGYCSGTGNGTLVTSSNNVNIDTDDISVISYGIYTYSASSYNSIDDTIIINGIANGSTAIFSSCYDVSIDGLQANLTAQKSEVSDLVSTLNGINISDGAGEFKISNSTIKTYNHHNSNNINLHINSSENAVVNNVTVDSVSDEGLIIGMQCETPKTVAVDGFYVTGTSHSDTSFILLDNNEDLVATLNDVSFNGENIGQHFYGIIFNGKQIDISNASINADSQIGFRGIYIKKTCDIANVSNVTIVGSSVTGSSVAGSNVYGLYCTAVNSIITDVNSIVSTFDSNAYAYRVGGESTVITDIVGKSVADLGSGYGMFITTTDAEINGCDLYGESINKMLGAGLIVSSKSGVINTTEKTPNRIYGKEWGFQYSCVGPEKFIVNDVTVTSTCHPVYAGGSLVMNNSKMYLANREKYSVLDTASGGIFLGSSLSLDGTEKVVLNNCQIGSESEKDYPTVTGCVVSQRNHETNGVPYSDVSQIDLNNCTIWGGSRIFVFQTGAWFENCDKTSAPNTTKMNINQGTVIYKRDAKSQTGYSEYTPQTLANDVVNARKTFLSDYRDRLDSTSPDSNPVAFTQYTDINGNVTALWTDEANVYDNRTNS